MKRTILFALTLAACTVEKGGGTVDPAEVPTAASLSCAAGEYVAWDGSAWTCAAAPDPEVDYAVFGSCPTGQKVTGVDPTSGAVACDEDADTDTDTTYAAGEGLTLSGTEFQVDFAGGGTAGTAARSDHTHDYLPVGAILTCSGTDKVAGINPTTGNVTCAADVDTGTGTPYTAGAGLSLVAEEFSVSFAGFPCSGSDKISGFDVLGNPTCTADVDTTYTAGDGLSLAVNDFSVDFGGDGVAVTASRSDHTHPSALYGDGSAGTQVVDGTVCPSPCDLSTLATDGNLNLADLTIDAGVEVTIPSGTVIRCTGTFTNNGTITVSPAAHGGSQYLNETSETIEPKYRRAVAGASGVSAQNGELVDTGANAADAGGGTAGINLTEFEARMILRPGRNAGGGGGGGRTASGGDGGGSIVILARTAIVNSATGVITADGGDAGDVGAGGGGGGFIILASPGTVTNEGLIRAHGGVGGDSGTGVGAGGGGGGGVIHVLTPAGLAGGGSVTAAGGNPGTAGGAGSVTLPIRAGGASGGDGGRRGGTGGDVVGDDPQPANGGLNGYLIESSVDPTYSF